MLKAAILELVPGFSVLFVAVLINTANYLVIFKLDILPLSIVSSTLAFIIAAVGVVLAFRGLKRGIKMIEENHVEKRETSEGC